MSINPILNAIKIWVIQHFLTLKNIEIIYLFKENFNSMGIINGGNKAM